MTQLVSLKPLSCLTFVPWDCTRWCGRERRCGRWPRDWTERSLYRPEHNRLVRWGGGWGDYRHTEVDSEPELQWGDPRTSEHYGDPLLSLLSLPVRRWRSWWAPAQLHPLLAPVLLSLNSPRPPTKHKLWIWVIINGLLMAVVKNISPINYLVLTNNWLTHLNCTILSVIFRSR